MSDDLRLIDWKTLKEVLGWPYTRTHTRRMTQDGRFPASRKFGTHRGARIVWRWKEIRHFFEDTDQKPDA